MARKSKSKSKASAISDRSGFKFPMSEMIIEPGTNYLVHRSESDGRWSENRHPLNNLGKYLKGKGGDPYPVQNARPRPPIASGIPVYQAVGNTGGAFYLAGSSDLVTTGIGSTNGTSSSTATATVSYLAEGSASGTSTSTGQYSLESLQELISSTLVDIDATDSDSYSGTGDAVYNLVDASTYEFTRSGSVSFTGTAGTSSGAFVAGGGAGKLTLTDGNTIFINNFHKNNVTDWWFAMTFEYQSSGFFCPISNISSSLGDGFEVLVTNSGATRFRLNVDRSNVRTNNYAVADIDAGNKVFIAVSYDSSNDQATFWTNSSTGTSLGDIHSGTSTVDASGDLTLFSRFNDDIQADSGAEIYSFAAGDSLLTDSEVADLIEVLELRHNRSYT